ncbi:MAG TPA: single-stranded-DNA-specific exonuclease RecJ [Gammaproteobacteria bacterium]|nr:single-stranded-DNA-specific exonuclease RecJ [Gammaproteobacteria bacterium]
MISNGPRIARRQCASAVPGLDGLHPVLRRVYAARGVASAADVDHSLRGLLRTEALGGLERATALLAAALREDRRIVVVADFDADGATSCAVAIRGLKACGARHVDYVVPNRFEYGYGLTPPIVELVRAKGADLLITVDNGISSLEGVAAAKAAGLAVLITDHHLPGAELPAADAIVNPNVPGDAFPSKALAGVGVMFYVLLALRAKLRGEDWFAAEGLDEPNFAELLDLVALGTVADVVTLDANNRRLVAQGLARIRAGRACAGIDALLKIAGRDPARLYASDLGFAVGPRLNAAGRLADMSLGIECLLSEDPARCARLARELDALNRERRAIERDMREQALDQVLQSLPETGELPHGICVFDPAWHQGVVGIVAGRVKERYHRPAIAFALADADELKGSARSIPGVHIRDVLDSLAARHPDLLSRFGGHAMAAGLSLRRANFDRFAAAFDAAVAASAAPELLTQVLYTDGALEAADMTLELARLLASAAPWGQAFPEPLFDGEFEVRQRRVVGSDHLRLDLACGDSPFEAIAFNAAEAPWAGAHAIRAAYRLAVNEWQGVERLQLVIEYAESI